MNLLTIENLSKSYTERMLLSNVSFSINKGDKIGVIGINGTGKSTLMKIIAGLLEPDDGILTKGKKIRISYLAQIPVFEPEFTILQNVLKDQKAENEYRNLEGEARAMLLKLGITNSDALTGKLSGGQKKRVSLVRTLLTPADILVLDEPTNHLDSEMAEWLEEYLNKYNGSFIMITHDRYFLDKVTNKIIELEHGNLYSYQANYSKFIELKAEREEMEIATERKNKSIYRMELEWMMRGARARSTKQKAHIKRFEELRDRKIIETDGKALISSISSRLGKKTMLIENISKGFDGHTLIKDFSYILLPGDRIGMIGPNGCGKSTLLNMIAGNLSPDSGSIEVGTTVKLGYFSQENEYMDEQKKVIEYIRDTAELIETPEGIVTASQMCERFLFTGSMQYSVIAKLSGGEKRRLYLLKILMEAPNILVLDEPTNDLDIPTLTTLEDYLDSFDGIVITVSHDRYFLDRIAERIFAFESDGIIRQYEGNFSDYKEKCSDNRNANSNPQKSVEASPGKNAWKQQETKLKFTYKEETEYKTIDDEIASLEQHLNKIDELMEKAATNYTELTKLTAQKEDTELLLEEKMNRWVYLNDLSEQIEAVKNNK